MGHHLHLVQGFAAGLRIPRSKTRHSSPSWLPRACRAAGLRPPRSGVRPRAAPVQRPAGRCSRWRRRSSSDWPWCVSQRAGGFQVRPVARSAASVAQRKSCRRPARSLFWHAVPVVARLRVARVAAQEEQREKRNADSGNGGDGLHRRAFRSLRPGAGPVGTGQRSSCGRGGTSAARGAEFVPGDLADPALVVRLCEDVEAVVHCAGAVGVWGRANASWRPTSGLPRASSRPACGKGAAPGASVVAVDLFRRARPPDLNEEYVPRRFSDHYGATKYQAEQLVLSARDLGLKCWRCVRASWSAPATPASSRE